MSGSNANAAIVAAGLTRTFGEGSERVTALSSVDLTVEPGDYLAIIGKSGAGKSTLLQLIGALDRGYTGSLKIGGRELAALDDAVLSRLRNEQIGFVFQAFNLLKNLTVGENLTLPATFGTGIGVATATKRARGLLERVGLLEKWDKRPLTLSGGERQRVAIARALLLEPPILICDEPTGSLDAETATSVMELFEELRNERACTLILVTHDPDVAARASRVLELSAGRVVADGSRT